MKKHLSAVAMLVFVCVLLCGCSEIFVTPTYRSYSAFANGKHVGTNKQQVLDKLGYPDASYDGEGNRQSIPYAEREQNKDKYMDESSTVWVYECYKYSDPRDPYRLFITFDEGECIKAELEMVEGG